MKDPTLPAILGGDRIRSNMPEWPILDEGARSAFEQLMLSGDWGKYTSTHTKTLIELLCTAYVARHVLLTCSGTAAIELALRAANIGAGDEVIMAGYDYNPNFKTIRHIGATPVLVDIRADNAQLNVELVQAALSDKTKAVLATHLHGAMIEMQTLREVVGDEIVIIEDACQMPGATYHNAFAGLSGDLGVISFGGTKTLSAGRGGALLTNHNRLAFQCRKILDRGNAVFPLSEMQAALLLPQLKSFNERKQLREQQVAGILELVTSCTYLIPFPRQENTSPDYYKLGFWYNAAELNGLTRHQFIRTIRLEGIPFGPGFEALHKTHLAKTYRTPQDLPQSTRADQEITGLHHPFLLEPNALTELISALSKIETHAETLCKQVT